MTMMAGNLRLRDEPYVRIFYRCPDWSEDRPDVADVVPEAEAQITRQMIEAEGGRITGMDEISLDPMLI